MSHDPIMRALVRRKSYGLRAAWYMFTASRAHGIGYGLTFREWFPGAWSNFCGYLRKPKAAP